MCCLILISCNCKVESNYSLLFENIWIYNTEFLADSIQNYTDNYLKFEEDMVRFNDESYHYEVVSDTIRFYEAFYLGGSEKKEYKESNRFIGIIKKIDKNELVIQKLEGTLPLMSPMHSCIDTSSVIKFANQETKKKNVKLNYVSFASTTCFGTCPEIYIELTKDKRLKYRCNQSCKEISKGEYETSISQLDFDKIKNIVSYLNLSNDTTLYPMPMDVNEVYLRISTDKGDYFFSGYEGYFQYKMQELSSELSKLIKKYRFKQTSNLQFKVKIEHIELEKTIEFLPPIVLED
jgi:hypothetical protein